jgi:hypothetical protein
VSRLGIVLGVLLLGASVAHAASDVKVDDLCRAVLDDSNYKVRVQAALVRGIAAQALGQLGDGQASDPLRDLLKRESDAFVRGQAEKAVAALAGAGGAVGGGSGGRKAKIYLSFGPFTGGVKSAGPEAAKIIQEALLRDMGKLPVVTLSLSAADQHNFAKTGLLGFYIDGNITRLEDIPTGGGSSETNCDVKVMVARWPSKSIIMWTNAGASLQSGSRPRDKDSARRDCLEASAGQLSEDLGRFFKSQGG